LGTGVHFPLPPLGPFPCLAFDRRLLEIPQNESLDDSRFALWSVLRVVRLVLVRWCDMVPNKLDDGRNMEPNRMTDVVGPAAGSL
jgi:hypothetical protein